MPAAESLRHRLERRDDLTLVERKDRGDDARGVPGDARRQVVPGDEETCDDASRVGEEVDGLPRGEPGIDHRDAAASTRACCIVLISAMVDSAPSLRFGPSADSPS